MPTVSYAYDNTPPTAVTFPSQTHNNAAPGAIALNQAQTGAAPAAITVAAGTMNNAAPGVVPLNQAHDNTAPTGIAIASTAQTGGAPAAVPLNQAHSNAAPGAIPLASTAQTADVPQQVGFAEIVTDPTDLNMHTAALNFVGNLVLNQSFGFYKAPATEVIRGAQLSIQKVPTGADVIIELVDSAGVSLGRTATLPAGSAYADVTFGTPLPVLVDGIVRGKVVQIGSGSPGGYLTMNLIAQVT